MQSLVTLDWVIIAIYFTVLVGIAVWVIRKKEDNTEDYFLAGKNVGWFVVGASIFASNIGSEHVVGLAGAGAGNKLPMLIYEIQAWIVLILGWVFLPFYQRAGVFTMPEFLEKRFDERSRWILSIFSIAAYVLTKISVTIYAGGVVVSALLGIDFWTGAIATVLLTGLYTVLGGMRAVVYTETLQAIILVIGAGGAARGCILPILNQSPSEVVIANRTASKAASLAQQFNHAGNIKSCEFAELSGVFDIIINSTSASLSGALPPIDESIIAQADCCYDMAYGSEETCFLAWARELGVAKTIDGLGMLVGQAAESFRIWRGVLPKTDSVLNQMRQGL